MSRILRFARFATLPFLFSLTAAGCGGSVDDTAFQQQELRGLDVGAEHRGHLGALVVMHRAQEGDVAQGIERGRPQRGADEERGGDQGARLQEAGSDRDRARQHARGDDDALYAVALPQAAELSYVALGADLDQAVTAARAPRRSARRPR